MCSKPDPQRNTESCFYYNLNKRLWDSLAVTFRSRLQLLLGAECLLTAAPIGALNLGKRDGVLVGGPSPHQCTVCEFDSRDIKQHCQIYSVQTPTVHEQFYLISHMNALRAVKLRKSCISSVSLQAKSKALQYVALQWSAYVVDGETVFFTQPSPGWAGTFCSCEGFTGSVCPFPRWCIKETKPNGGSTCPCHPE